MFTIRCTRVLLDRLDVGPLPADAVEPGTTLGDWYANILNVGRLRLLMCTSERSLLTVLLPARDLAGFPIRLRHAVAEVLPTLGISELQVAREVREMSWHQLDRTRSRVVLGSMNDFAFMADVHIREDGPGVDLSQVARMLNRAPCSPIAYKSPDTFSLELFRGSIPGD